MIKRTFKVYFITTCVSSLSLYLLGVPPFFAIAYSVVSLLLVLLLIFQLEKETERESERMILNELAKRSEKRWMDKEKLRRMGEVSRAACGGSKESRGREKEENNQKEEEEKGETEK